MYELKQKFGKASQARQRKINNVQAVKSSSADVEEPIEQDLLDQVVNEKKVPKRGELVSALKTVKAELAELRETLTNQQAKEQETGYTGNQAGRRGRLCTKCQEVKELNCDHCFRCGSSDHFARRCKKRQNSGNGRWLQPRDRKVASKLEIGKTRNCVKTLRPSGVVFPHNFSFSQFSLVLI